MQTNEVVKSSILTLVLFPLFMTYGLWPREASGHNKGGKCVTCHPSMCDTVD